MTTTAKYATAECQRCHIRLPKPEMVSVTLTHYVAGTERTYYGKYGNKTGRSVGSGRTSSKEVWLCRPCNRKREVKNITLGLGALSVVIWFLAVNVSSKNSTSPSIADSPGKLETSAYTPQTDRGNISPESQPDPIQPNIKAPGIESSEKDGSPASSPSLAFAPAEAPRPETHQHNMTLCDRLAANPNDNDKHPHAPGVPYEILRTDAPSAIEACRIAAQQSPDVIRFRYQYARALQSITPEDAAEHLLPLVEIGYPAAFDNYGWLNIRLGGDIRESERYFRSGVERGNADAMHSLAELIIKKRIRPRYKGEALELMYEAAKRDHELAIAFIDKYEDKRRSQQVAEDLMLGILGGVLGGVANK